MSDSRGSCGASIMRLHVDPVPYSASLRAAREPNFRARRRHVCGLLNHCESLKPEFRSCDAERMRAELGHGNETQ
jgi:hypothetical protein